MTTDQDRPLSEMTGARQTMSAWAKVIEPGEAVPEAYRSAFAMVSREGAPFPYTVFAPSIAGWRHKTTERLLGEAGDTIYVWERSGDQVQVTAYPLDAISDLEIGSILLLSWITISGVTTAGSASSTTIEFNTATSRHFAHFVNKWRPAPKSVAAHAQDLERAKLAYLRAHSFKFMNYAIESLVDGAKVLQTLWQPKICKPGITLGGRSLFQTTLSLAHLALLTDQEFIVIQDDERSRENRGVRYGGKRHYIALKHISAVSVHERADDVLTLSLTLSPGGRRPEFTFAAAQRQELAQLEFAITAHLR